MRRRCRSTPRRTRSARSRCSSRSATTADAGRGAGSRSTSSTPAICSAPRTRACEPAARRSSSAATSAASAGRSCPIRRWWTEADYLLVESTYGEPRPRAGRQRRAAGGGDQRHRGSRRQDHHSGVRDRPGRGDALLDQAARGGEAHSRCCRCSSTARWRWRRWRATPSACTSSIPNMQPEARGRKGAARPGRPRSAAEKRREQARAGTPRLRVLHAALPRHRVEPGVEAADALEDAGDRHLVERHGHRRPRAASPEGRAAGSAQHRAVRRLPGRGHARPASWSTAQQAVKIHGQIVPVNARIERIESMSAHADSTEILRWLGGFKRPPTTTFLVHGEPAAMDALAASIQPEARLERRTCPLMAKSLHWAHEAQLPAIDRSRNGSGIRGRHGRHGFARGRYSGSGHRTTRGRRRRSGAAGRPQVSARARGRCRGRAVVRGRLRRRCRSIRKC